MDASDEEAETKTVCKLSHMDTHELTGTVEHGKREEEGTKLEHGKIV